MAELRQLRPERQHTSMEPLLTLKPGDEQPQDIRTRRLLLSTCGNRALRTSTRCMGFASQLPVVGLIATVGCTACIIVVILASRVASDTAFDRLDIVVLALAVALLAAWSLTGALLLPRGPTDESAFVQYAANLQLHGHNPYNANLLPAMYF